MNEMKIMSISGKANNTCDLAYDLSYFLLYGLDVFRADLRLIRVLIADVSVGGFALVIDLEVPFLQDLLGVDVRDDQSDFLHFLLHEPLLNLAKDRVEERHDLRISRH